MRERGVSYTDIAQILGVTRQAVHQLVNYRAGDSFHAEPVSKIRYIGLRNWMLNNRVGFSKLSKLCGVANLHTCLTGPTSPNKRSIDAILRATGLTYEECFKEEECLNV